MMIETHSATLSGVTEAHSATVTKVIELNSAAVSKVCQQNSATVVRVIEPHSATLSKMFELLALLIQFLNLPHPKYLYHTQIVLSGFVLLFSTIIAP